MEQTYITIARIIAEKHRMNKLCSINQRRITKLWYNRARLLKEMYTIQTPLTDEQINRLNNYNDRLKEYTDCYKLDDKRKVVRNYKRKTK